MEDAGGKVDRRVIRTKKRILEALIALLEIKSIEEIQVREIMALAEVSRGTFYVHYDDKYDLLEQSINTIIRELQEKGHPIISTNKTAESEEAIKELVIEAFTEIFKYVKVNNRFIRLLFSENSSYSFHVRFNEVLKERLLEQLTGRETIIPSNYWMTAVSFAYQGLIHAWISSGMKESPRKMGEYGYNLIFHSMAEITRGK